ncbi:AhpA/YtjB family protein [Paraglaciecola sp. 2405UD69-4]|uniref:AhpA/YtjB family protein n=1 Tax=Paraglaciecola sp. 2405UD69-4 TaxID=3391836 RepID=UPI0039C9F11F
MENSNTAFVVTPQQKPSRYSIFKRIANLLLVVIGVLTSINLWLINSEQAANWHYKQANQLGISLVNLSGNMLTTAILEQDSETLVKQLTYITDDPHVLGATLYDKKGRLLADNKSASSLVAAHKIGDYPPLVFVRNIVFEDQVIGYLTLLLKKKEVMRFHSEYQRQLDQQLQMLMLLAAVGGVLVARAFYKFKIKRINKKKQ